MKSDRDEKNQFQLYTMAMMGLVMVDIDVS